MFRPPGSRAFLTLQPEIQQAMVFGDKRPHLHDITVVRDPRSDGLQLEVQFSTVLANKVVEA